MQLNPLLFYFKDNYFKYILFIIFYCMFHENIKLLNNHLKYLNHIY